MPHPPFWEEQYSAGDSVEVVLETHDATTQNPWLKGQVADDWGPAPGMGVNVRLRTGSMALVASPTNIRYAAASMTRLSVMALEAGTERLVAPQGDQSQLLYVNARLGLRLREGPGTDFGYRQATVPFGTAVYALKTVSGWTLVDLEGDGRADGFMSSGFLQAIAPLLPRSTDVDRIPDLITQGSMKAGLKSARDTAKKAHKPYPANGCAAHLSALLQQAGIDVKMTLGAGQLAKRLELRGWSRVPVGQQRAGDVGVCFDFDPTPPGADHVYLVISTNGPDEMRIADNQRIEDEPHLRWASGKTKTPTEYFLRA